jgi:hypothetical protein
MLERRAGVAALWAALFAFGCKGGGGAKGNGDAGTGDATPADARRDAGSMAPLAALDMLRAGGKLPDLDVSASVSGPDGDGDGVRDDVAAYLASLTGTPPQHAALLQLAKAFQKAVTADPKGQPATVTAASESMNRAIACIWSAFGDPLASGKVSLLRMITVNTKSRFASYARYDAALDGTVTTLPQGASCD